MRLAVVPRFLFHDKGEAERPLLGLRGEMTEFLSPKGGEVGGGPSSA